MAKTFTQKFIDETKLSIHELLIDLQINSKNHREIELQLIELDTIIEDEILKAVDLFLQQNLSRLILIRYYSSEDFSLYEPELFEILKSCYVHKIYVDRTKRAIERIGGIVKIVFMDSDFYESWLSVNDFDDSQELRILWAKQQVE